MDISTENQTAIRNCYQAMLVARAETDNYDVDREFADYAPKFTIIDKNGSVETLQQVRSGQEESHKTSRKWSVNLHFEQFDMRGDQATVVLFKSDDVLLEYPSDVIGKLKFVTVLVNQVCKDTWLNTDRGWKLFRSHILHDVSGAVGKPEYVSPNSSTSPQEAEEAINAMTISMAYSSGICLSSLGHEEHCRPGLQQQFSTWKYNPDFRLPIDK